MKRVDPACVGFCYSTDCCAIGVSWHGTAASVQGWNPLAPQIRRESVLAYRWGEERAAAVVSVS
jgi:hypothetical protein